jgi:2,4'-dihydroxyacetophenone dioxygenase
LKLGLDLPYFSVIPMRTDEPGKSMMTPSGDLRPLDERMSERPELDTSRIAYQLPQPTGMIRDLVLGNVLNLDCDELDWVAQSPTVSFKPLLLGVSEGYYVNILRVRSAGILSRHRHSGPVHALTLRGRWRYLEHDWTANAGDYIFEPPGETHTLVVPDDVNEMVTLFHVGGGYTYVDPYGKVLGYEDVFTKLENVRRHYEQIGLGAKYADRFVR